MNDTFRCGDHDALVAYLYDEGERTGRDAVAAHLAHCVACAEEIAALRATRTRLAAWAPPDASLGFRITAADQRNEPLAFAALNSGRADAVRRPWWREPLPAWAQAAAAALIFAAGLTAGWTGGSGSRDTVAMTQAPAPAAERVARSETAPVAATDLARFEQRLRAIELARAQPVSAQAARPLVSERASDQALLAQVNQLIADSEERLRRENVTLVAGVVREFEAQRRVDLRRVDDALGNIQTVTGQQFRRQDEALSSLVRVSLQPSGR